MVQPTLPHEQLLQTILHNIHNTQKFQESLNLIVEQIRDYLGVDRVKIYKFASDGSGDVIAEAIFANNLPSLLGLKFPATDLPHVIREQFITTHRSVAIDVATKQKTIHEPDQNTDHFQLSHSNVSDCHIQYLLGMGVLSSLCTPIFHEDELWGLLVVHHSEPRRFAAKEWEMVELLSKQVSLTIAQDTLKQQTILQSQQEAFLHQVSHQLTVDDWQGILESSIATLNADGGRLYIAPNLTGEEEKLYVAGKQPSIKGLEQNSQWIALMKGENPKNHQAAQVSSHIKKTLKVLPNLSEEEKEKQPYLAYFYPKSYQLAELAQDYQLKDLQAAFQEHSLLSILFIPLRSGHQWEGCLTLFKQEQEQEIHWAGRDDQDSRNTRPRQSFEAWIETQSLVPDWQVSELKLAHTLGHHLYIAINQQKIARLIIHKASYDSLTQLPSGTVFSQQLSLNLLDKLPQGQILAVMIMDINRFKRVNESLGHQIGDYVLQRISERLQNCLDKHNDHDSYLARWHGDRFIIQLSQVSYTDEIVAFCEHILETFDEPFYIQGQALSLSASLGVAIAPYDGDNSAILLKNSEIAMNQAKEKGKNTYRLYDAQINPFSLDSLSLETDLYKAIERNELRLYYQPQVNLKTGQLEGVEALLRWQHPRLGLVSPAQFIPLAEEIGLICPIGEWVIKNACKQQFTWQKAGFLPLKMSVNLSYRQFQQPKLVEQILDAISTTGINPQSLELEITESLMMEDLSTTLAILKELQAQEIQIAIDDFGTGYSSLGSLKNLPVNTLKIDKSLIENLMSDPKNMAILQGIMIMGQGLNLNLVAEGVESPKQIELLQNMGCDQAQGYLLSPPLPPDQLTKFLLSPQLLTGYTDQHSRPIVQSEDMVDQMEITSSLGSERFLTQSSDHLRLAHQSLTDRIAAYTQLEAELKQQISRERLVMDISKRIRQSLKLEEILNQTASEVRHFLNTDRVILYRFNQDWSGKVVIESLATGMMSIIGETIDDPCFRQNYVKFYRQGRVRAIEDIQQAGLAECHVNLLTRYNVKANLVVPIVYEDKIWGLMIAHHCRSPRHWSSSDIQLLNELGIQVAIAIHQAELVESLEQSNLQLQELSCRDSLTQIANRHLFDEYLAKEWQRLMRSQDPLSLILCDVDHFKLFNDTYGHPAGDSCLRDVAQVMNNCVFRAADLVARYGGEEFAVILPQTEAEGAMCVAEAIRKRVMELRIPHAHSAYQYVTLSLGIATLVPISAVSPQALIVAADEALYKAKATGRNQAC
ncbi:MAG: diguanylate cyclase [Microcystaceae cyanobacterium]